MCQVMNERLQSVLVVEEEFKQPNIDRIQLQMETIVIEEKCSTETYEKSGCQENNGYRWSG